MKQNQIKAIRGMNDLLPPESRYWLAVEAIVTKLMQRNGFEHVRTPLVESTQLFARSIGADTDIVAKEMYTFDDRNGDSLTLRPEGTASCVRASIQNGLLYNQQQRFWYMGPMFRYERPQKGRYRQFHQLGVESFGWSTPEIEAEIIDLACQLFEQLGLKGWRLEINNLGDTQSRSQYRNDLITYFSKYQSQLDADSQRRLTTNPLRILDSKDEETRKIAAGAPSIVDSLSAASRAHLDQLKHYLDTLGIAYTVNPAMVRGLDYYNDTVFEFICDDFGAQSTVCGGGRYDGLVEQLGGQSTPAFGFGLGLERLIQLLEEQGALDQFERPVDVYIVSSNDGCRSEALRLKALLVRAGVSAQMAMGDVSFKNQFKRADKSNATLALVLGSEELAQQKIALKLLRSEQTTAQSANSVSPIFAALLQAENKQMLLNINDAVEQVTNLLDSL